MPRPESENVFIARWRDRLGLAVAMNDEQALIEFARWMYSIEDKIDVTWRTKPKREF